MPETPTNPPITSSEKALHYAAIAVYFGLLAFTFFRLWPFWASLPWRAAFVWAGWFGMGLLLCLPFADLLTGLVHILLDDEKTKALPFLRTPAENFQRHHTYPGLLAQQPTHEVVFQTVGNGYFYILGFHAFFVPGHPLLCGFLIGCSVLGAFVQWIHQQAHTKGGFHLWLSPAYHHVHHTSYDRHFNIVAGGLGWLTDALYPRLRPHGPWAEFLAFGLVLVFPIAAAFGVWFFWRG